MAHAPSLTRTERAAGICERAELELQDNGTWRVRDTATGSGRWHTVFAGHCTCADYTMRGATCKHLRAVAAEEQALAQYCADWNTRAEQARIAAAPGHFLDGDFSAFDDELLTAPARGAGYKGEYYTEAQLAAAEQARAATPRCPECGSELESRQYYVGGRGYQYVKVCTRDAQHRAKAA